MRDGVTVRESWTRVGGRDVHAWHATSSSHGATAALVVVLPGLGLPTYAVPTFRAIAAAGAECVLLDLPGFGEGPPPPAECGIEAVGRAAAAWVERRGRSRRLVVVGHSTGAQAALVAALRVQETMPGASLVLAGPTFMPPMRTPGAVLLAAPRAYREDSLRELRVLPALSRSPGGVLRMLLSGLRDAPERRIAGLRLGVTLTAGRSDAYAPRWWLNLLGASARQAAYASVVQTPGSHNAMFTHPAEVADVVLRGIGGAAGRAR